MSLLPYRIRRAEPVGRLTTSISGNYGDLQQYGDWFVNVLGPLSTQLINGAITPEAFITQLDTDTAAFYQ